MALGHWAADYLNGGTAGGGIVIGMSMDVSAGVLTLDKTYREIYGAVESGILPYAFFNGGILPVQQIYENGGAFYCTFLVGDDGNYTFSADSEDGVLTYRRS